MVSLECSLYLTSTPPGIAIRGNVPTVVMTDRTGYAVFAPRILPALGNFHCYSKVLPPTGDTREETCLLAHQDGGSFHEPT